MKPITRKEQYYEAITSGSNGNLPEPVTREEQYLKTIAESGGGGGGGTYHSLPDKPSINNHVLEGNMTSEQIGLTSLMGVYDKEHLTLS